MVLDTQELYTIKGYFKSKAFEVLIDRVINEEFV